MATTDAAPPLESSAETTEAFPAVEIEKELNPGLNAEVKVDPISSRVAADVEIKEQAAAVEQKREKDRSDDTLRTLKSAILISAAIVAVAGAAFAITKKLREK